VVRALWLIAAILVFILSLFLLWNAWVFKQPNALKTDQFYMLNKGVGVQALTDDLYKQNIIHNKIPFMFFAVLSGNYKKLQAGEYEIKSGAPMAHLLYQFSNGKVYKRFVTIPEGKTSVEIIRILDSVPHLTGSVSVIPEEGSLMPETYSYTRGDSKQSLITRMQSAMSDYIKKSMATKIPPYPLQSVNDILTLASIVEKETGQKDERRMVAGVFINRLNRQMKLETDPTVIYGITMGHHEAGGLGPLGRRLLLKDLQTPNPYNTYLNFGLPPTPIANPGKASIDAVFNPELHDYLFFVADGTGGHAFARNYTEHLKNVERWRAIRPNLNQ
jgi:UPF0755 protein